MRLSGNLLFACQFFGGSWGGATASWEVALKTPSPGRSSSGGAIVFSLKPVAHARSNVGAPTPRGVRFVPVLHANYKSVRNVKEVFLFSRVDSAGF